MASTLQLVMAERDKERGDEGYTTTGVHSYEA